MKKQPVHNLNFHECISTLWGVARLFNFALLCKNMFLPICFEKHAYIYCSPNRLQMSMVVVP